MIRQFVAYFFFVGWDCLSLGIHICWSLPNFEIHLPFGFIRIGWVWVPIGYRWAEPDKKQCYGYEERKT